MTQDPIDLRSDTVTRPSPEMREAMARAEVGDDVFAEDPTVQALEAEAAARFGKPAGLFFPSGCMANLTAMMVHAPAGGEAICERHGHTFDWEHAGAARLAGVQLVPVPTPDGLIEPDALADACRPRGNPHVPITRLVVLENTHNMHGGKVVPLARMRALAAVCRERQLPLHVDGARIFNACVASGSDPADYGATADSLMFCLSKGLGAPAGSLLVGEQPFIAEARRVRKMLGGGMRQVGVLAAAGQLALAPASIARLARDHEQAQAMAAGLNGLAGLEVEPPETNIVRVRRAGGGLAALAAALQARGVLTVAVGEAFIRLVTHRDLPDDAAERTIAAFAAELAA